VFTPVVLCILDGVGWGRRDDTDAVFVARTPNLDALLSTRPNCLLKAHGRAVGLPSDADMGNSEVGHNAMGAGRVVDQGASLVDAAIASGAIFETGAWAELMERPTVHFIGLVSDGNVHSHVKHLRALVARAAAAGKRVRVHALTDGRDVSERSALTWIEPLEAELAALPDARIASGGGRMRITMDRYEADWEMVRRGWDTHVHGVGRAFPSATDAIRTLYTEDAKTNDQWLAPFVVTDDAGAPVGRIRDGDAVVFFNFRGDRAIEISRAFVGDVPFDRGVRPDVVYAGMMMYDGDTHLPPRYLVEPPAIDRTVGELLVGAGVRTYAVSETQKFGHVTYFFNGNRSGRIDEALEEYAEVPSDNVPFEQAPAMKCAEITERAARALRSGRFDHIRLNLANGDMVGHSGDFAATVAAMEAVDACVGRLVEACEAAGAILLVTADHGNADEMYELDKKGAPILVDGRRKPRTSHSLNPVPFILLDPTGTWRLECPPDAGIAQVGGTLLALFGVPAPADYLPPLVTR
jgi:2,3-bisphosphoglycerate-independent phosphoglycerate mutase